MSLSIKKHLFCPILLSSFLFPSLIFAETTILRPKTDHRVEPVGIEDGIPVFRWNLEDTTRNTMQKKYRICVATSPELLKTNPDCWDSGWIESYCCIEVKYEGKPLESSKKHYWTVQIINNRDEASELSELATFVTGLFNDDDWKAKWISMDRTDTDPMPIFRKSFFLDSESKKLKNAFVHICGLGHYELRLNGSKVGQSFIDPGWTNYKKTCLYSSYDVTTMLQDGENVFGVLLGNGMYNVLGGRYVKFTGSFGPPKMIAQLELFYEDGTRQTVATDDSWKTMFGPIVFSCVYGGEDFDATKLEAGWDRPNFNDATWTSAKMVDGPGGLLRAQEAPPIMVAEILNPITIKRMENGQYIVDFGYNFSGRPRIYLHGPAGAKVTVKTGELIDRIWEGHSYTYTLCGSGKNLPLEKTEDIPNETVEILLPKFSYFGFQFLRIEGAVRDEDRTDADQDKPTLVAVQADFTTSFAEKVGEFHCSNEMINEIDAMIDRSVRSNLQSVLTDCPHREKLGWLEVAHLMAPSIMSRYDVQNLYRKICRDTTESQLENGLVPDIAPEYTRFSGGFFESPEWGSSAVLLPVYLSIVYGDTKIVPQQYDTMKRYIDYLAASRDANGLVKAGLGDWYDWTPEKGHAGYSQLTPGELTATAMLYNCARMFVVFTRNEEDQVKYSDLVDQVWDDYLRAYAKPDGNMATGSQASLAFSLAFAMINDFGATQKRLVEQLEKDNFAPTTGEVAFHYLIEALSGAGRNDLIWKIITRTEKPGYGYMLKECNMKTLSETWDGPGSSMNHCMFGHAQKWFTSDVLGIRPLFIYEGIFVYRINPTPVGDLTSCEGYYDSPCGRIECSWKIENERFQCKITSPANVPVLVMLPFKGDPKTTILDGKLFTEYFSELGIESETTFWKESGRISCCLASGTYQFETDWKNE